MLVGGGVSGVDAALTATGTVCDGGYCFGLLLGWVGMWWWPLATFRGGWGRKVGVLLAGGFALPVADDLAEVVGDGPQVQFDVDLFTADVDAAAEAGEQLRE